MNLAIRAIWLLAFWLLAWGEASVANVLSGLALATALLFAFPPRRRSPHARRISIWGTIRLIGYVLAQLVTSNLLVAREILSPRSRVRTGVLAYEVEHPTDEALTLIANVIALSPGTMAVEITRDPAVIYAHFLLLDDIDDARRTIARLERLVVAALGGPRAGEPERPVPTEGAT